ncbi:MAG TPA: LysE family translocator [Wenzhouxiangellaceae bacterium]|nr:LysE family translocator [Wenzhouxiangellaceae bacterium]
MDYSPAAAMGITEALVLVLVMLPLAAMPSSSVALVVARSVGAGRLSGAFSALGIVAGDLVFVAMALIGMNALAEWLGALFSVVKVCGGAYLIWLGASLVRSRARPVGRHTAKQPASYAADFLAGLFLTLGDIKAIFFYASLLPTLVDMESIGLRDIALVAGITVFTVGGVKLAYAIFAAEVVARFRGAVSSELPRKLGGAVMIGCGSVLIAKA